MKLTMLGTGNASVTKCYNTCFTLSEGDEYFLVDGGGGNGILNILEEENISIDSIHHVFVSHGHTDHVLGIIWILRIIAQHMHILRCNRMRNGRTMLPVNKHADICKSKGFCF